MSDVELVVLPSAEQLADEVARPLCRGRWRMPAGSGRLPFLTAGSVMEASGRRWPAPLRG